MEVEGVIEAISYKNKGIKVAGRWFNVPDDILKRVQKNQKVKLYLDDFGNVMDIEILGYEEKVDKEIKLKAAEISELILRDFLQFGQTYDLVPASEQKGAEESLKRILETYKRIYKFVLNLIK